MKPGCRTSNNLTEIDEIYITGCTSDGFYKKAAIHEHLINHPGSIQVNLFPYPNVIPAVSINGERYVKSSPNAYQTDNLLNLPRC